MEFQLKKTLTCDHSDEKYWAVLSCGSVYYAVQGASGFWVCGWNPVVWYSSKIFSAALLMGTIYFSVFLQT